MGTILALDSGSPEVSVALARNGDVLGTATAEQRQSSARLVPLIEGLLRDAALALADLDGLVALRGPGSFTGLRIGLATTLGFHQALELPATAISTLEALAATVEPGPPVLCLVHALRQTWYVQAYTPGPEAAALHEPQRVELSAAMAMGPEQAVGHLDPTSRDALVAAGIEVADPGPLAPHAARRASLRPPAWDASLLTRPLYLTAPPATPPGPPKPVLPPV